MKFSAEEMLYQWRLRRALLPMREDCTVTRYDGIDLDSLLRLQMRDWYLNLLDTAPLEMLTLTDISADIAVVRRDDGLDTVTLPGNCRRLVEFRLEEWERPAEIVADPHSPVAVMQTNPFSRGGACRPVAVCHNNTLYLYSVTSAVPKIAKALAVMLPEDGTFEMNERALSLIPTVD